MNGDGRANPSAAFTAAREKTNRIPGAGTGRGRNQSAVRTGPGAEPRRVSNRLRWTRSSCAPTVIRVGAVRVQWTEKTLGQANGFSVAEHGDLCAPEISPAPGAAGGQQGAAAWGQPSGDLCRGPGVSVQTVPKEAPPESRQPQPLRRPLLEAPGNPRASESDSDPEPVGAGIQHLQKLSQELEEAIMAEERTVVTDNTESYALGNSQTTDRVRWAATAK
ncbi:hypothetical protein H8959_019245 [Pygathrix nigripes]